MLLRTTSPDRGMSIEWRPGAITVASSLVAGVFAGFLLLSMKPLMVVGLLCGTLVMLGAAYSVEFGVSVLLVTVILFNRSELFAFSIPFFGGGFKPTDLLLMATLGGWVARAFLPGNAPRGVPARLSALAIIFVLWGFFCAVMAISGGVYYKHSLLELRPLLQLLLLIPIATEFRLANIRRVILVILIATALVSIKGMMLYAQGQGEELLFTEGGRRVLSIGFTYLLCSIIITITHYFEDAWSTPALTVIGLLALGGLIVTFFRTAWLGLAGSLLYIFVIYKGKIMTKAIKLAGAMIVIGSLVFTVPAFLSGHATNLVVATGRRILSIGKMDEDVSAQHRFNEWNRAIEMIRSRPILGNGLGARVEFYSPLYSESDFKMGYWSNDFYVHNSYLWILTKMGIIGFVMFIMLIGMVMKAGIRRFRVAQNRDERAVLAGLTACLVALMVTSFFGPTFTDDSMTPFVGFAFGAIYALQRSNPPGRRYAIMR